MWTHAQNSVAAAEAPSLRYPPMEHLSNDHEGRLSQYESNHKMCNEKRNPVLSLGESQ